MVHCLFPDETHRINSRTVTDAVRHSDSQLHRPSVFAIRRQKRGDTQALTHTHTKRPRDRRAPRQCTYTPLSASEHPVPVRELEHTHSNWVQRERGLQQRRLVRSGDLFLYALVVATVVAAAAAAVAAAAAAAATATAAAAAAVLLRWWPVVLRLRKPHPRLYFNEALVRPLICALGREILDDLLFGAR